jgi:crotonobetainyl-CoA:carnitine CoA-transferase CaiB-like acyl-CoA transferase
VPPNANQDLTARLREAYTSPATTAQFDLEGALDAVLRPLGLSALEAGGDVRHVGADPVLHSPLRIGAAATIGLLAKSIAAAAMHRWRGGKGQNIFVDLRATPHRLCPFYDGKWELVGRYPVRPSLEAGNALGMFFQTRDGRWVLPQAGTPTYGRERRSCWAFRSRSLAWRRPSAIGTRAT